MSICYFSLSLIWLLAFSILFTAICTCFSGKSSYISSFERYAGKLTKEKKQKIVKLEENQKRMCAGRKTDFFLDNLNNSIDELKSTAKASFQKIVYKQHIIEHYQIKYNNI
jgi:hypothetical protein